MRYAGRVYDGPWEGRQLANDNPWYFFHIADPADIMPIRPGAIVNLKTVQTGYRWSYALRAWVFADA